VSYVAEKRNKIQLVLKLNAFLLFYSSFALFLYHVIVYYYFSNLKKCAQLLNFEKMDT